MSALLRFFPLALEGQWHGAAAVALVLTGVVIFMGSIYVLLAAIYGWRQAYLVTVASIAAFLIILSGVWLFGIPGTIPGFGPRGTEPHWIPFLTDSEQGREFSFEEKLFPNSGDWRKVNPDEVYPGQINAGGEVDAIKNVLKPALAGYFQRQGVGSADPNDYNFRLSETPPVTEEEKALPAATLRYWPNGTVLLIPATVKTDWLVHKKPLAAYKPAHPAKQLLVGITIPATKKHPAITVLGFRDKGRVFQPAAMFFVASIILFALHLWLLARFEARQKRRDEELAASRIAA